MRCPYCGHVNSNNAKKCDRCGRRLDDLREQRQEKRILLYGIVLIALILAAGIGAMFGMSHILDVSDNSDNSPQKVTIVTTPVPTEAAESTEEIAADSTEAEASESAVAEPAEEEEEVDLLTGTIVDSSRQSQIALLGYSEVGISSTSASSTIYQAGVDNSPDKLFDHIDGSSWQDGVVGDGIGENLAFNFDKTYKIKFLTVRLGNWYSTDDYYYRNNRPQTITFDVGTESFSVSFPDQKTEFCVELSREVETASLRITINSVYEGTEYDDTCINELTIYGFATGDAPATTITANPTTSQVENWDYSWDTTWDSTTTDTATTDTGLDDGTTDYYSDGSYSDTGYYSDGTDLYGDTSGTYDSYGEYSDTGY